MKARRNKTAWLCRLKKTGTAPKSKYRDGMKWPTAIPGKVVEIYPPRQGPELAPHYYKYLEENETFWCETLGRPAAIETARKTDTSRCLNRLANPQLFPECKGCSKFADVPLVKKESNRECIRCGETKPTAHFKGVFEVAEEFLGWCKGCVAEHVDSVKHPVERGEHVGPLGIIPARHGCTFCGDGSTGTACQFCVTELSNYTLKDAERLYWLLFNNDTKREIIETYSRITDAAKARVAKEYEEINQEYFEYDRGRLIAYKKEKRDERLKTVGRIHKRREIDGMARDRQEEASVSKTKRSAMCSLEQDGENVLDEFDIGVSKLTKI